nr:MAG TPA: hypothetical protein [Caudoviricetes sp.]
MLFNVRLLLVTGHKGKYSTKTLCTFERTRSSLKWTLRGLCGLVKHFFNGFLKEHINRFCGLLMPLI